MLFTSTRITPIFAEYLTWTYSEIAPDAALIKEYTSRGLVELTARNSFGSSLYIYHSEPLQIGARLHDLRDGNGILIGHYESSIGSSIVPPKWEVETIESVLSPYGFIERHGHRVRRLTS